MSDSQKGALEPKQLYRVVDGYLTDKQRRRKFPYGYSEELDAVVISKDGTVGDVYEIENLLVVLPAEPDEVVARSRKKEDQYWERAELPKELERIRSIYQWRDMPKDFKVRWSPYIEEEFDRRDDGLWFMNNGVPTYITGSHYMYLQWDTIDVGYPDFREGNRILYLFWEACKADTRSYGMSYLKNRRSGFSFMAGSEAANIGTSTRNANIGVLSKTGPDAKKLFTEKIVSPIIKYPFFFKPIQDGMDRPKTELSFRAPAQKISRKNMREVAESDDEGGLETTIDWKNTANNSYDSQKLRLLIHDESGKWLKPESIIENWRVTKTCCRIGKRIVGKCMMGSTSNALSKGGKEFKKLFEESDVRKRSKNGQTKTGLYSLFIPMDWNYEGFIDIYGWPVFHTPKKSVLGVDGEMISQGVLDYWANEEEALKGDSDALNEFYRQFPRTTSHAFRDESKESLFSLTKIYEQLDFNEELIMGQHLTRGKFMWENGVKQSKVIWVPDNHGRFLMSWVPPEPLRNRVYEKNGRYYPQNTHLGAFGCDSYDISGVVGGGGSNGALHGKTGFHMEDAPVNQFFLEYIARPQTAEIFFEDVVMAIWFCGMEILAENNKPRLLYNIKNRGMRPFSMNRPDKPTNKLSSTEKELGGIPNSSEDIKQAHAAAIESYIEKYVGIDHDGIFREPNSIGYMPFDRTLRDWAGFDINNRTKFDASISSGLSCMATQKHLYHTEQKQSKISINFARYNNKGTRSERLSQ